MHHSIWKILYVLGADEYLERLEGKIRKWLFFYVKILLNNSVNQSDILKSSKRILIRKNEQAALRVQTNT